MNAHPATTLHGGEETVKEQRSGCGRPMRLATAVVELRSAVRGSDTTAWPTCWQGPTTVHQITDRNKHRTLHHHDVMTSNHRASALRLYARASAQIIAVTGG
jgi:hypothetical protein